MQLTSIKVYYKNIDNPEIIWPTTRRPSATAGRKARMWRTPLLWVCR